jgi:hypothetical protein
MAAVISYNSSGTTSFPQGRFSSTALPSREMTRAAAAPAKRSRDLRDNMLNDGVLVWEVGDLSIGTLGQMERFGRSFI